jgi:hypothetical protein
MKIEELRNKKDRTSQEDAELKLREKVIAEFEDSPNPSPEKTEGLPQDLERARETEIKRFQELKNKGDRTQAENEELGVLQDFLELTDPNIKPDQFPSDQEVEETRKKIETLKNPPVGSDLDETLN